MTGLFSHRSHNQGRGFAVWRALERKAKIRSFAEMLSEEVSPADAAVRLGHTKPYGRKLLNIIRKDINDRQRAAGFGDWA